MLVPMIMVQAIPHSWEIYATRTDTRGENFMLYFFLLPIGVWLCYLFMV